MVQHQEYCRGVVRFAIITHNLDVLFFGRGLGFRIDLNGGLIWWSSIGFDSGVITVGLLESLIVEGLHLRVMMWLVMMMLLLKGDSIVDVHGSDESSVILTTRNKRSSACFGFKIFGAFHADFLMLDSSAYFRFKILGLFMRTFVQICLRDFV